MAIALSIILAQKTHLIRRFLVLGTLVVSLAYVSGVEFQILPGIYGSDDARTIGARQLVQNVMSIFGGNSRAGSSRHQGVATCVVAANPELHAARRVLLDGKRLRRKLGRGRWFSGDNNPTAPPLRSPHNAFMTILARGGVPGLTLWVLTLTSWLGMLLANILVARRRGDVEWTSLFIFIACYGIAILVDAAFDIALEGPMLGLWFWCLFGIGVGSVMIYRANRPGGGNVEAPGIKA